MKVKSLALLNIHHSDFSLIESFVMNYQDQFNVTVITGHDPQILVEKSAIFQPAIVVIEDEKHYEEVNEALWEKDIITYAGWDAVAQVTENQNIDTVWNGYTGKSGMQPAIFALKTQKQLLQPDSFTGLSTGNLLQKIARENRTSFVPFDALTFFYYAQLLNYPIDNAHSITFLYGASISDKKQLQSTVMLLKILPELQKKDLHFARITEQNTAASLLALEDGSMILAQSEIEEEQQTKQALYFPEFFKINNENMPQLIDTSAINYDTPLDAGTLKKWSEKDVFACDLPLLNSKTDLVKLQQQMREAVAQSTTNEIENMKDAMSFLEIT